MTDWLLAAQKAAAVRRIAVLGPPGSGKSTFSRRLRRSLGLPLYHLDDEFWGAGWKRAEPSAFLAKQREIANREAWIIDGLYAPTLPVRMARAQMLIILDVPIAVAAWGYGRRAIHRALGDRATLPRSVRLDEKYRWRAGFDPKVLRTLATFRARLKPEILRLAADMKPESCMTLMLSSRTDADRLIIELASLREAHST